MMRCLSSCFDVTRIWRQDGAGELIGEEALDQVEPGAVLGREGKVEAAWRPGVAEPGSGFPRNVCVMIVEDQLDRGAGRIGVIEKLEEFDELAAAVAPLTSAWTLPVSRSIPANRLGDAMAYCTRDPARSSHGGLALAANPVPSWRWHGSRLLVVGGDDRDRLLPGFLRLGSGFFQDLDLAVDTQNFRHLGLGTRRRGVPDSSAPCAA